MNLATVRVMNISQLNNNGKLLRLAMQNNSRVRIRRECDRVSKNDTKIPRERS